MTWLTRRLLGFIAGGLGLALAASAAFGFIQTERLQATKLALAARELVIETLEDRIANDAIALAQRDAIIEEQNAAVTAMAEASKANRKAYELRLAQAESRADSLQTQAQDIMTRTLETEDELERSRAALRLIQEVVEQESP